MLNYFIHENQGTLDFYKTEVYRCSGTNHKLRLNHNTALLHQATTSTSTAGGLEAMPSDKSMLY